MAAIYEKNGIRIEQYDAGWLTCRVKRNQKTGEEYTGDNTYHATLAQACARAAHRVADAAEAKTLANYASLLRATVAEICVYVPLDAPEAPRR